MRISLPPTQLPPPVPKPHSSIISCSLNSHSAQNFRQAFLAASPSASKQSHLSIDELVSDFNDSCLNILDSIASFKEKKVKWYSLPWIIDHTRGIKRQCRKAERKWKKDRLVVSLDTLKGLMSTYRQEFLLF